MPEFQGFFLSW